MDWYISLLQSLSDGIFSTLIKENRFTLLLDGLAVSLQLTLFAALIGLVVGLFVAVARIKRIPVLSAIADLYVTIIRGTPVIVQLIIIYFIIIKSIFPVMVTAMISFGINSGAYVSEIIRAGIMAVDNGQLEASRSLGLSYGQSMFKVIVPQAIKNILPALGNEFIVLLKETSVAGYIALDDLTRAAMKIRNITYDPKTPLFIVAYLYLLMTIGLTKLLDGFERRLREGD